MFNLFLVFVVLPIYIVRALIESNHNAKRDAIYKSEEKIRDDWKKSVTDMELEKQLQKEILKHCNDNTLDAEFEEAIREVPGILEHFRVDESSTIIHRIGIPYALMIMLANRGKITYDAATFGVNGSKSSINRGITEKQFVMIPHLMKWINKKLVEHGIDERLVIKWGLNQAFIIDDFEKCIEIGGGHYTWEPNIATFGEKRVKLISEE